MASDIMLPRGFPNTPPWPEPLHGGATIGLKNELPYLGVWHPPLKVIPADEITALYFLPEITALYILPAHWARSFRDVPRWLCGACRTKVAHCTYVRTPT